jgi:diadenosine tetraphosphate (Ap4A) HIT family hydrolase
MSNGRWPADWYERKRGRGCPMCSALGQDTAEDHAVFVHQLATSEVRLERRSRLPGYCIVIWRHGHVAEPTQLDPDAAGRYWADVLDVSRAIEHEFRPLKMNLLTLGNWVPHLHTHVLPRYLEDPAPGGPITWADIFQDQPTPPHLLSDYASRIKDALARPGRRTDAPRQPS